MPKGLDNLGACRPPEMSSRAIAYLTGRIGKPCF
ncbi:hypothetical protein CBM2613_B110118 [Cupriavidus taiwanensis]|uniref:Uncharacterized protein n=1 Tax=Cupriavidus taiwanensis TaxID=164546 RepID=A0A976B045_9BURK|nr:hypothetical protein CBM2613_B110118 [Cupriavidus taiwanensis]